MTPSKPQSHSEKTVIIRHVSRVDEFWDSSMQTVIPAVVSYRTMIDQ
jgi:hypothetical protein